MRFIFCCSFYTLSNKLFVILTHITYISTGKEQVNKFAL